MSDKLYLRPVGIVWGDAASDAIAEGVALPVAGGPAACLGFEVTEGEPGRATRCFASASDLAVSLDASVKSILERITSPRQPVAGLGFGRPVVMGIVNVTPDSFSDGGDFAVAETAVAHAHRLAAEGAAIVDIGGESTRPGAEAVDEAEELRRVPPVLDGLRDLPAAISIDTRKAAVMRDAAARGAKIINDVSALTHDPAALPAAAQLGLPVILMHAKGDPRSMQDEPAYADVLLEVYDFLEARIAAVEAAGIPRRKLIADPGIGFGKTIDHNLKLLAGIGLFHGLGVPMLLGASRKRMIGTMTGETNPKRRAPGSIGIALAAASQAVQIFRVHDVGETRQALDCWFASASGRWQGRA
ncbi:MAG: dihydropteroate synthase [Rhodomicrobiaceae bacterium]